MQDQQVSLPSWSTSSSLRLHSNGNHWFPLLPDLWLPDRILARTAACVAGSSMTIQPQFAFLSNPRSALGDRGLLERGAQALGELHGIVIGPEMNEDHPGLLG